MNGFSNEELMDKMMDIDGKEFCFVVERDTKAVARDGLGVTISEAAFDMLLQQMKTWIGTRIMRQYEASGIMPQRVEVTVSVKV